jgi:hypothetical protein
MSHPITIPVFCSNSGYQSYIQPKSTSEVELADDVDWTQEMSYGGGNGGAGVGGGVGDTDMDFDLLAEYLLEDNPGQAGSGISLDIK